MVDDFTDLYELQVGAWFGGISLWDSSPTPVDWDAPQERGEVEQMVMRCPACGGMCERVEWRDQPPEPPWRKYRAVIETRDTTLMPRFTNSDLSIDAHMMWADDDVRGRDGGRRDHDSSGTTNPLPDKTTKP